MIYSGDLIIVDPYRFVLLLHMLYYEVDEILEEKTKLSLHDIGDLIYIRIARKNFPDNIRDPIAHNIAESYRKKILPFHQNIYSKADLDFLVRQITLLGKFTGWEGFSRVFGGDQGALISKEKYSKLNFKNMDKSLRRMIERWVDDIIDDLHEYRFVHRYDKDHSVILSDKFFSIRAARWEEIQAYVTLVQLYGSDKNRKKRLEAFKSIHDKFQKAFYIYIDKFGVTGLVMFLPIKETAYNEIMNGEMDDSGISSFSLDKDGNYLQTPYFYIGLYHSYSKEFTRLTKVCLDWIISILPTNRTNHMIALAKSEIGKDLLLQNSFTDTGHSSNFIDSDGNQLKAPIYQRIIGSRKFH